MQNADPINSLKVEDIQFANVKLIGGQKGLTLCGRYHPDRAAQ